MQTVCTITRYVALGVALALALGCDDPGDATSATTDGPGSTGEASTRGGDATDGATLTSAGETTGGDAGGSTGDSSGDATTGGVDSESTGAAASTGEGSTGGEDIELACEGDPCVTNQDCSPRGDGLLFCAPVPGGPSLCVAVCDPIDPDTCDGQAERCNKIGGLGLCLPPVMHVQVGDMCVPA